MKLEMSFNGCYQGERDKIVLINKLIKDGTITDPKYHRIELKEVEPETQESFFDYIFEDMDVFQRARKKALAELRGCNLPSAPSQTGSGETVP